MNPNRRKAQSILSQLTVPRCTLSQVVIKASGIEPLTDESRSQLIRLGYNTYTRPDDLSRVWSIEHIEGSDYIVALDSGAVLDNRYSVQQGERSIDVTAASKLIYSIPVEDHVDTSRLAAYLNTQAEKYQVLPKNLFLEALLEDYATAKAAFVSTDFLRRKAAKEAGPYDSVLKSAPTPDVLTKIVNQLNLVVPNKASDLYDKAVQEIPDGPARQQAVAAKQSQIGNFTNNIVGHIKSLSGARTVEDIILDISDPGIIKNALLGAFADPSIQKTSFLSNMGRFFTEFGTLGQPEAVLGVLYGLMAPAGGVEAPTKERKKSPGGAQREEKQREIQELLAKGDKILGIIESKSYSIVLQSNKKEQVALKQSIENIANRLGAHLNVSTLGNMISKAINVFIQDPENAPISIFSDSLKGMQVPPDFMSDVIQALRTAFNVAYQDQRNIFFGATGVEQIKSNAFKSLFYKVSDTQLKVVLDESNVPPELHSLVSMFMKIADKNPKIDNILAEFIQASGIVDADKIRTILAQMASLSDLWEAKAGKALSADLVSKSAGVPPRPEGSITSNQSNYMALDASVVETLITDTYNQYVQMLPEKLLALTQQMTAQGLGGKITEEGALELFEQQLLTRPDMSQVKTEAEYKKAQELQQNYKATIAYLYKLAAFGSMMTAQGLSLAKDKFMNPAFGGSKIDLFNRAVASAREKMKRPEILYSKEEFDKLSSYVKKSAVAHLYEVDPVYAESVVAQLNAAKTAGGDVRNIFDILSSAEKYVNSKLKAVVDDASKIQSGELKQAVTTGQQVLSKMLRNPDFVKVRVLPFMYDDAEFKPLVDKLTDLATNPALSEQAFNGESKKAAAEFEESTKDESGRGLLARRFNITPDQIAHTFLNLKLTAGTPDDSFKKLATKVLFQSILKYGAGESARERTSPPGAELLDYMILHNNGFKADIFAQFNGTAVNLGTPTSDFGEGTNYNPLRIVRETKSLSGFPDYLITNVIMSDPLFKEIQMNVTELEEVVKTFGSNIIRRSKSLTRLMAKVNTVIQKLATPERVLQAYDGYLKELEGYRAEGQMTDNMYSQQVENKNRLSQTLEDSQKVQRFIGDLVDEVYGRIMVQNPKILEKGVVSLGNTPSRLRTRPAFITETLKRLGIASVDETPFLNVVGYLSKMLSFGSGAAMLFNGALKAPKTAMVRTAQMGDEGVMKSAQAKARALVELEARKNRMVQLVSSAITTLTNPQIADLFRIYGQQGGSLRAILSNFASNQSAKLFGLGQQSHVRGTAPTVLTPEVQQFLNKMTSEVTTFTQTPEGQISHWQDAEAVLQNLKIKYTEQLSATDAELSKQMDEQFKAPLAAQKERLTHLLQRVDNQLKDVAILKQNPRLLDMDPQQLAQDKVKLEAMLQNIQQRIGDPNTPPDKQAEYDRITKDLTQRIQRITQDMQTAEAMAQRKVDIVNVTKDLGMPEALTQKHQEIGDKGTAQDVMEPVMPERGMEGKVNLDIVEAISNQIHFNQEAIKVATEVYNTIFKVKAELTHGQESIMKELPIGTTGTAEFARLSAVFPMTPYAKRRNKKRMSSAVNVFSPGFMQYLHNELKDTEFDTGTGAWDKYTQMMDMMVGKMTLPGDPAARSQAVNDRNKMLSIILDKLVRSQFYSTTGKASYLDTSDITTVFTTMHLSAASAAEVEPIVRQVASNYAQEVFGKNREPEEVKRLETSIVVHLMRYLSQKDNFTIARETYVAANENLQKQGMPPIDRSIEDIKADAYMKFKHALKNPATLQQLDLPYTVSWDLINEHLPSGGNGTADYTQYSKTWEQMDSILNDRGATGAKGPLLRDLLGQGQHEESLRMLVDMVSAEFIPYLTENLNAESFKAIYPASRSDREIYGVEFDANALREDLSEFTCTLSGFLFDYYKFYLDGMTTMAPKDLDAAFEARLQKDIDINNPLGAAVAEIIKYYIYDNKFGNKMYEIEQHIRQTKGYLPKDFVEKNPQYSSTPAPMKEEPPKTSAINTQIKYAAGTAVGDMVSNKLAALYQSLAPSFQEIFTKLSSLSKLIDEADKAKQNLNTISSGGK